MLIEDFPGQVEACADFVSIHSSFTDKADIAQAASLYYKRVLLVETLEFGTNQPLNFSATLVKASEVNYLHNALNDEYGLDKVHIFQLFYVYCYLPCT